MIGIVARLMALPGMLIMELRVLQTAEAAMEAVPRVLIRWLTSSLPIWNMPFSMPAGIPMARIRWAMEKLGFKSAREAIRSGLSWRCSWAVTQMAARIRPVKVAIAAPRTSR